MIVITRAEMLDMADAMKTYGGSFVKALGIAFVCADEANMARLLIAFPEYVREYAAVAQRVKKQANVAQRMKEQT